MIISAIIALFSDVVVWIINIFPNSQGLPSEIQESFDYIVSTSLSLDYYFPVVTLLQVFAVYVSVSLLVWAWKAARWLISLFRGAPL